MMESVYLGLVERMLVLLSWMQCFKLLLSSIMVHLSTFSSWMLQWCSFCHVEQMACLCSIDLNALTGDIVYLWCPQSQVILDCLKEIEIFFNAGQLTSCCAGQHSVNAVEG
jgi:hypothetical protein